MQIADLRDDPFLGDHHRRLGVRWLQLALAALRDDPFLCDHNRLSGLLWLQQADLRDDPFLCDLNWQGGVQTLRLAHHTVTTVIVQGALNENLERAFSKRNLGKKIWLQFTFVCGALQELKMEDMLERDLERAKAGGECVGVQCTGCTA